MGGGKGCSKEAIKWGGVGVGDWDVKIKSLIPSGSGAPLHRASPPARLSIVFLPRSVDVVEERHGERHAQELWRRAERTVNESVLICRIYILVSV